MQNPTQRTRTHISRALLSGIIIGSILASPVLAETSAGAITTHGRSKSLASISRSHTLVSMPRCGIPGNHTEQLRANLRQIVDARPDGTPPSNGLRHRTLQCLSGIIGVTGIYLAYRYDRDAASDYSERDVAYTEYQLAYTTEDVVEWRTVHNDAEARGDRDVRNRNIAAGVAALSIGFGIAFTIWP